MDSTIFDLKWLNQSDFGIRSTRPCKWKKRKIKNVLICAAGWWLVVLLWMIFLPSQEGELSKEAKNARIANAVQVTL